MCAESLRVTNNIAAIKDIAVFIEQLSEKWTLPIKASFSINLILEELISNIIFYGYQDKLIHYIDISITRNETKNSLLITIEDDASEFNLLDVEDKNVLKKTLEEREIGGLGIHFVKKMMDDVSYKRIGNKNRVQLTKKLSND